MSTVVGEARQAGWTEWDDGGPVLCVTNTVTIADPNAVWFLGGALDQPDETLLYEWSVFVTLPLRFKRRERPEIERFEKEHAAFLALLPHLESNYGGRFVAIHHGSVVDSDVSREDLVRRFFARFGDVPVYIGYVGESPVAYQVTPFQI